MVKYNPWMERNVYSAVNRVYNSLPNATQVQDAIASTVDAGYDALAGTALPVEYAPMLQAVKPAARVLNPLNYIFPRVTKQKPLAEAISWASRGGQYPQVNSAINYGLSSRFRRFRSPRRPYSFRFRRGGNYFRRFPKKKFSFRFKARRSRRTHW